METDQRIPQINLASTPNLHDRAFVCPPASEVAFNLALRRWRQLSRPWWRKHNRARVNMMRWMHARGGKARRRLEKWANEYERTLFRMPNPPTHPDDSPPNATGSAGGEYSL